MTNYDATNSPTSVGVCHPDGATTHDVPQNNLNPETAEDLKSGARRSGSETPDALKNPPTNILPVSESNSSPNQSSGQGALRAVRDARNVGAEHTEQRILKGLGAPPPRNLSNTSLNNSGAWSYESGDVSDDNIWELEQNQAGQWLVPPAVMQSCSKALESDRTHEVTVLKEFDRGNSRKSYQVEINGDQYALKIAGFEDQGGETANELRIKADIESQFTRSPETLAKICSRLALPMDISIEPRMVASLSPFIPGKTVINLVQEYSANLARENGKEVGLNHQYDYPRDCIDRLGLALGTFYGATSGHILNNTHLDNAIVTPGGFCVLIDFGDIDQDRNRDDYQSPPKLKDAMITILDQVDQSLQGIVNGEVPFFAEDEKVSFIENLAVGFVDTQADTTTAIRNAKRAISLIVDALRIPNSDVLGHIDERDYLINELERIADDNYVLGSSS